MKSPAALRELAARKYHAAEVARRVGPSLSLAKDQASMLQHAQDLEAEAAALESEADKLKG
jgi:hypothetical protein